MNKKVFFVFVLLDIVVPFLGLPYAYKSVIFVIIGLALFFYVFLKDIHTFFVRKEINADTFEDAGPRKHKENNQMPHGPHLA